LLRELALGGSLAHRQDSASDTEARLPRPTMAATSKPQSLRPRMGGLPLLGSGIESAQSFSQ